MIERVPSWLHFAVYELGQHEIEGGTDNPRIQEYLASVGMVAATDEVPWCAAFVNFVLLQAGVAGTGMANARSYEKWGKYLDSESLRRGAVLVWPRGKEKWMGHVNLLLDFDDADPEFVYCIGGNQHNRVSVVRCELKKLVTARWPEGVEI